jgi:predicted ATPase
VRDGRSYGAGPYLRAIRRAGVLAGNWRAPLLPLAKWMAPTELDLSAPATFFVGENGTGKSTLLEAIAAAAGFAAAGGPLSAELEERGLRARPPVARDREEWIVELTTSKPRAGFFLRAESFFNVASVVDERELEPLYGGRRLHEQSHGESFVALATNRFGGEGLYLLDEPEAALSVTSALAFLEVMHAACAAGAQFIVATHSPILLALPGARILELADGEIAPASYDELPLVQLHRSFLAAPERFLRHLWD